MFLKIIKVQKINEKLKKHIKKRFIIKDFSKCFWWLVLDNNEIIGYSGARRFGSTKSLYYGPVFINKKYRGLGLQRKLLKIKEKFAKNNNYTKLIATTDWDNIYSANNLIKQGFKLRKPWTNKIGLYWEKNLLKYV